MPLSVILDLYVNNKISLREMMESLNKNLGYTIQERRKIYNGLKWYIEIHNL